MLDDNGDEDVIAAVKKTEGRCYLPSEVADKLRQVVREEVLNGEGDQGGEE